MKTIKLLIIIAMLPLLAFTTVHKYYLSVTNIEYVSDKQSVQIISRIFIDDLELVLRQRYDENITLGTSKNEELIDAYIQKYLDHKIQIKINDTLVESIFIGKEYDNDVILCYLEIENVTSIKSFEITSQVLFDLFEKQQNIVKLKINSKNKSFVLIQENDKAMLNF